MSLRQQLPIASIAATLLLSHCAHATPAEAIPVTTKPLEELVFFPTRDAPAVSVSLNDVHIGAEVSGQLREVSKKVGEHVAQGEALAQIDCQDYEIAVTQAEAAQKAARAKYVFDKAQLAKAQTLSKNHSISSEELDRRSSNATVSSAELDRLEASLQAAERSVQKCSVRAPFNAIVIERIANVGDYVTPGSPVARILDQENIEVSAKVQEQDIDSLRAAKKFQFVGRHESFPLRLRTILPVVNSKIRSYEARLTFVDKTAVPGSAGRLQWTISTPHVPASLLVRRNGLGIFVFSNAKARFQPLNNAVEGQPAPVDVEMAAEVIVKGRFRLTDGDPVTAVNP